jgi:hypothetical protein
MVADVALAVCYMRRHLAEARVSVVGAFGKTRVWFSAGAPAMLLL